MAHELERALASRAMQKTYLGAVRSLMVVRGGQQKQCLPFSYGTHRPYHGCHHCQVSAKTHQHCPDEGIRLYLQPIARNAKFIDGGRVGEIGYLQHQIPVNAQKMAIST